MTEQPIHRSTRRPFRRHAGAPLVAALVLGAVSVPAVTAHAVPDAGATVIDDFDDGDVSDWGFFGGNAAGGGGGALADRPYQGSHYLSTGWGGQGTASSFYGGAFTNLPDTAQVTPPADPWLNAWVLNQSDATADAFVLELTIREDLDGNGWTAGAEDSFRLDTAFTRADFDDRWRLVSAPLSGLVDLGTGGNGTFDGSLDEVVVVVSNVQGADGSTVELDLDQLAFSSGGPLAFDRVVVDDMEHGDPFANGWFTFGGAVGGGGVGADTADVSPVGGSTSLQAGWGSGGVPGFYGGFGVTRPLDVSGTDRFNLWINPDAGQDYTLEINLQDDDGGDDAIDATDDEFQYACVVSPAGPCAVAGGGWQQVSIPLDQFSDDNSFLTGGNGVLDPTPVARGGNGRLVNVVVAVIGNTGSDATFRTDDWVFSRGPLVADARRAVDRFEAGLPSGAAGAVNVGFSTFQGAGSSIAISNPGTPPAPPRAGGTGPGVLQLDLDVTSFAGVIHAFENATVDAWVPQDWSTSEGLSLWLHGTGSGTALFIDVLDNRNPGSTTDDAERWTVTFRDDTVGWHRLEFPFSSFTRKEIGNGAPNDGFTLFDVHGWAFGTLGTGGARTYYIDDVELYGVAEPPALAVQLARQNTIVAEGDTAQVAVKLNRPMGPDDPAEVSIDFATERSYATPGQEFTPTAGTLTFVNGGPSELTFPVETFEDTKFEGDEQVVVRLTGAVGAERGPLFQGSVLIDDDDAVDADLLDDFEQGAFLWETDGLVELGVEQTAAGAPGARPGQDAVEHVATLDAPRSGPTIADAKRSVIADLRSLLPATSRSATRAIERAIGDLERSLAAPLWENGFVLDATRGGQVFRRDANAVDELDDVPSAAGAVDAIVAADAELAGLALEVASRNGASARFVRFARAEIRDAERDAARGRAEDAIDHYRRAWSWATLAIGLTDDPTLGSIERDFAIAQDWSDTQSLDVWFEGTGSGQEVTVTLQDNRAPDPGPAGWELVWSDEFDAAAGTAPDPDNWSYEIGDTTPDGKNGWGNEELQYYTDDNAATDGDGNLVITLDAADGSQECYYGPCRFESARLITQHKAEFAYGRIEARLQVPTGGDGLWPAFWSLGTDITSNPWPGAGEIDVMEYVSRIPNEIFGTIHGPGYNGGGSFSGIYDFGERVDRTFHTYAVEWQPDRITWLVDGIVYHEATPADVPGPWVFDKPFFLLLNFAIGGNFGGAVDPANTYPQQYLVDYVRVFQGPDTAERFDATFTDDTPGWQLVSIPIEEFVRSDDQPEGAPDDGLTLDEVWGYGFEVPYPTAGSFAFDLVRRTPVPPPTELVVTTLADDGPGSLRDAVATIAPGGTITVDPTLAGGTITLTSGQLLIDRSVTIDASAAAPLTIGAGGASRVLEVTAGSSVTITDVVVRDGAGAPQGGGILNRGALRLERVVVRDNVQPAAGPASFDLGGGGIYNGDGAVLHLLDSTVADNRSTNQPGGGVYGFFNSTITIERSTVSGNVSGDVAGGLRSLGDATIVNSTFSDNVSTAWHGGGVFHTDGDLTVTSSTFAGNVAPAGTASGILVATFGAPARATLTNNVLQGVGGAFACAIEGGGAATITSGGGNVIGDGSCNPVAADLSLTDAAVGPLADNGGFTATRALAPGSAAVDAALAAACPPTDQRGVARPQRAGCDAGAFELE